MSFILTAIVMFVFWILLSGEFHAILIISGIISSLFVAYLSHDLLTDGVRPSGIIVKPMRLLMYLPWLIWQIVIANIDVVYRTLHPSMPIEPQMIEFNTDLEGERAIAILANSITLTPGTVTIVAGKDGRYLVHALSSEAAEGLLSGDMQRRVENIEG